MAGRWSWGLRERAPSHPSPRRRKRCRGYRAFRRRTSRVDVLRASVYFDAVPLVLALLLLLTACSGPFPQSVFAPRSDFSTDLDGLYRTVFWWAVAAFVIVETLLLIAIALFRARPGAVAPQPVQGPPVLQIRLTPAA